MEVHDFQRLHENRNSSHTSSTNGDASSSSAMDISSSNDATSSSSNSRNVMVGHVAPESEWSADSPPTSTPTNGTTSSSPPPPRVLPALAGVNSATNYSLGTRCSPRRASLAIPTIGTATASSHPPVEISPRSHPMALAVASAASASVLRSTRPTASSSSSQTSRDRSASSSSVSGKKRSRAASYSASRQDSPSNLEVCCAFCPRIPNLD